MRTIALEEHVLPRAVADWLPGPPVVAGGSLGPVLDDLGADRLATMDEAGIDIQVLSLVGHEVQQADPDLARVLSRMANDRMAEAIAAHPDRFRAFAALPLSDPEGSVRELVDAVARPGFVGAMIHGQTNGLWLDDPVNWPLLEAAADLDAPLYLHPAAPPTAVEKAYFDGLPGDVGPMLARAGWGWHAETGMHVLRLATSGALDRFPGLRVIVGHMGEDLPFSLARADQRLTPLCGHLQRTVAETVLDHVFLTTSGYVTVPPLQCALAVFGADRIMFSVDHPFADSVEATTFLRTAPLSPDDRAKIASVNATTLLALD